MVFGKIEWENKLCSVGRKIFVQKGGVLDRSTGTIETDKKFLLKPNSQMIAKELKKGLTIRQVAKLTDSSTKTVMKVKKLLLDSHMIL